MIDYKLDMTKAEKRFSDVLSRAVSPNPAQETIAIKSWRNVVNHFSKEEGPNGRWPDIADSTKAAKGSSGILKDTGRLRQSNMWRVVSPKELHVYNTTKYAAIHNYGGRVPDRYPKNGKYLVFTGSDGGKVFAKKARGFKMKKREFMWLSPATYRSIAATLLSYVSRGKTE
jgi:phage gpG-like protein